MSNPIDQFTAPHYTWGTACDSWVLADTETLSVKQEQMPPDTKEKLHVHAQAQQFFFILNGTATFYLENKTVTLNAAQGLLIPAGKKHYIANETGEPLNFLVISQPSTNNDRVTLED